MMFLFLVCACISSRKSLRSRRSVLSLFCVHICISLFKCLVFGVFIFVFVFFVSVFLVVRVWGARGLSSLYFVYIFVFLCSSVWYLVFLFLYLSFFVSGFLVVRVWGTGGLRRLLSAAAGCPWNQWDPRPFIQKSSFIRRRRGFIHNFGHNVNIKPNLTRVSYL